MGYNPCICALFAEIINLRKMSDKKLRSKEKKNPKNIIPVSVPYSSVLTKPVNL